MGSLGARVKTRVGEIVSKWEYTDGRVRYEITVPKSARIVIDGKSYDVDKGTYLF